MLKLIHNKELLSYLSTGLPEEILLYYDGECPICRNYKEYLELRKKYDIRILNARDHLDEMKELERIGCDINQGMILVVDGLVSQGENALGVLFYLSGTKGFCDKLLFRLIQTHEIRICVYPLIKGIRKIMLFLLGVSKMQLREK